MKINWHPNPLKTTIETDERDAHMVLYYLQQNDYADLLCGLDMMLKDGKMASIGEVHKEVKKWGDICNMDIDSEQVRYYIDALNTEHFGDCTCVPCSCIRCHAEEALGISTIEGCGKHSLYKIRDAFGKNGDATIDEALVALETPKTYVKGEAWKNFSQADYESHIPRWEKEREEAAKWLRQYKEKHGF